MVMLVVFELFEVVLVDKKMVCFVVDGGLVMNNLMVVVVIYVIYNKVDFLLVNGVEDLFVLLLGNGILSCGGKLSVGCNGECLIGCVVDIVVDGVFEIID